MAKLTRIRVAGLKNLSFDDRLEGCDVFVGPNGSGKTSRLLAVWAGLRGVADTATDTTRPYLRDAASGEVTLDFDGHRLVRDLGASNKTRAGKEATILANDIAGGHLVSWDLRDFAAQTDGQRAKLLQEILRAGAFETRWSWEHIAAVASDHLGLDDFTDQARAEHAWSIVASLDHDDVARWIESAQAAIKTEFTRANAASRNARAVAQRVSIPPKPEGDVEAAAKALDEAEKVLATARAGLEGHERERTLYAQAIAAYQRAVSEVERHEREVARLVGPLAELEAKLKGYTLEAIDDEIAKLDQARSEAAKAKADWRAKYEERQQGYNLSMVGLGEIRGQIQALKDLAGKAAGSCRHCGGEDPLGIADRVAGLEQRLADTEAVAESERRRLAFAKQRFDAAREEENAADRAHADALLCRQAFLVDTERAEDHHRRIASGKEALEAARKAADQEPPTAPAAPEKATETLREREAEVATAKALVREWETYEAARASAREKVADQEAAQVYLDQVKAVRSLLDEVADEIARDGYAPITDLANELLEAANLDERFYLDGPSDFGLVVRGRKVPLWDLSDSERAICCAALASSFARVTGASWRSVLLDGLESIDADRRTGLLRGLASMVEAGKLDNVLGCLVGRPDGEIAKVRWHVLEAP